MAKNSDFTTQESITQMAKHNADMRQLFNSQNNIFNYNEDNFLDKNDDGLGDLHKLNGMVFTFLGIKFRFTFYSQIINSTCI